MESVEQSWARIEAWLRDHAPAVLGSLAPGATDAEITAFEQAFSLPLPPEVRASYRIHNGQSIEQPPVSLAYGHTVLSLETMKSEWSVLTEVYEDWDETVWHPEWLPLASAWSGDYFLLDLRPTLHAGQVLQFWHEGPEWKVVAPDFATWLSRLADAYEAGSWHWVSDDEYEEGGYLEDGPEV